MEGYLGDGNIRIVLYKVESLADIIQFSGIVAQIIQDIPLVHLEVQTGRTILLSCLYGFCLRLYISVEEILRSSECTSFRIQDTFVEKLLVAATGIIADGEV